MSARRTLLKSYRRYAEKRTVGLPYEQYQVNRMGTISLTVKCTKGIYRALKRTKKEAA